MFNSQVGIGSLGCGVNYAFSISRLDSTRSINGRMPSSLEMARDSSNGDMGFLIPIAGF